VALLPLGGALTTRGEDEPVAEHPVTRVQRYTTRRPRQQHTHATNQHPHTKPQHPRRQNRRHEACEPLYQPCIDSLVAMTPEELETVRLPAAAIPPLPAIFDVWLWSLQPVEELSFAAGQAPASIAADVVLAGEYTVRSEGQLQVQRDARLEEIPPGTVATVRLGDVVIYIDNQAPQLLRNPGDEWTKVLSVGVFSAAPPSAVTSGPLSQEEWARSGLAGQDLLVRVELLAVPPGARLPAFVPDVQAPRIFAVLEGVLYRARVMPGGATPEMGGPYIPDQVVWFTTLGAGEQLQLRNDEDQPLVMLEVSVSADPAGTPVASTPVA
jgi:hypothetical protein